MRTGSLPHSTTALVGVHGKCDEKFVHFSLSRVDTLICVKGCVYYTHAHCGLCVLNPPLQQVEVSW